MRSLFLMLGMWVGAAFVTQADETEPRPFADLVPAMVRISYDHDMGVTSVVELKNRKIVYTSDRVANPIVLEPTLNQWSRFIAKLNNAEVYKWQGHYHGFAGVRDGNFRWHVEIQIGERHFASDGDTAFPSDGPDGTKASSSDSTSFELLVKATSELIGHDFP